VIKLNVGNVFLNVEPQMALLDPAAVGSVQGETGSFIQMLEALLANAVGAAMGGDSSPDLSGTDRTLMLSGMLSLINPATGATGESAEADAALNVPRASTSLLDALAALRAAMAQDASSILGNQSQATVANEADAADALRDRLASPDGLMALAAAGWLMSASAVPVGTVEDVASDSRQSEDTRALPGAAVAGFGANRADKATTPMSEAIQAANRGEPMSEAIQAVLGGRSMSEASSTEWMAQASQKADLSAPSTDRAIPPVTVRREPQPPTQAAVESLTPAAHPLAAGSVDQITTTRLGDLDGTGGVTTPPLQQIVQGVSMLVRKGETQVRLQLHPESLGQVLVQLTWSKGTMSVHLMADTAAAHSAIQDHLTDLRTALANQGLQVDGLSVSVGSDPSAFNASAQHQHTWPGERGPASITALPTRDEHAVAPVRNRTIGNGRQYLVDYHV
jgi:flagellar hook-length control protein FliK